MQENKFRIGYFADGPWSYKAFELLIKDESISIEFIVPRSDTTDTTLERYSQEYNIDYLYPVKINSDEFYKKAESYKCDLFVSMSFNQIFRKSIMELPRLNTINCHAGKLPFYRGRNILNWALINDEKEFGITVHLVDEGIDTGDIILQRTFPITREDNYATLLEIAFTECASILYDAIKQMQAGDFNPIEQKTIHPVGFYCGRRGVGDEVVNWNQSSVDVYNFIRAICKPGPMARTRIDERDVAINSVRLVKDAPVYKNTIGQILSKTKEGWLVKTADSFIEITEVETEEKLRVGEVFH